MTPTELFVDIRNDIQDDTVFTDTQLLALTNEALRDFTRYTEIKHKDVTQTTAALNSLVDLPSDFVDLRSVRWSYNTQLIPRNERKLDYDSNTWKFEVGTPELYVFFNYNQIRVKPIPSAAGTVKFRTSYVPADLTASDDIPLPVSFVHTLRLFVDAMCFVIVRDYEKAKEKWSEYLQEREQARTQAQTPSPDVMKGQRNVNVFNYPMWDSRYRTWRP